MKRKKDNLYDILWAKEVYRRFFNGELSKEDEEKVNQLNQDKIKTKYQATEKEIDEGCEIVKSELFTKLGFDNPEVDIKIQKEPDRKRAPSYLLRKYAAAAILCGLTIGTLTFFSLGRFNKELLASQADLPMTNYCTETRQTKLIQLPDGSVVHINGGSRLSIIEKQFNKEKREVWLENGEAFFEVTKNPKKPFIVHSGNLQTTVRGTSFNVKSYKELGENSVSVRSGKVEVRSKNNLLGVLTKNKQIIYHTANNHFEEKDANWEDAAAWMNKRLVLRKANINELKLRIEQLYGVKLIVEGDILKEKDFNSSFPQGTSFQSVMECIRLLYGVNYKINNPQRVTIYK